MSQTVNVQIVFEQMTSHGKFRDALYFDQAIFSTVTQDQIDALIAARVAAFIFNIENPPPPPDPQYTVDNQDGTQSNV